MRFRLIAAILAFTLCLPIAGSAQIYGDSGHPSYNPLNSLLPELETIMRTDARHWDVSTYRNNSLRNIYVASLSNDQRSYVIRGTYNYAGVFSRNYQDRVDFHFTGNHLSCIEYGHERGCRRLLTEDRARLQTALIAAGAIAIVAVASSSSGSSASGNRGGYSGQTRYQCERDCSRYPGDSNPNVDASVVAQCRRRCANLPNY